MPGSTADQLLTLEQELSSMMELGPKNKLETDILASLEQARSLHRDMSALQKAQVNVY